MSGGEKSQPGFVWNLLCGFIVRVCRQLTGYAGAKLVRELGDEVVVDAVLHGAQDDHGSCVVD